MTTLPQDFKVWKKVAIKLATIVHQFDYIDRYYWNKVIVIVPKIHSIKSTAWKGILIPIWRLHTNESISMQKLVDLIQYLQNSKLRSMFNDFIIIWRSTYFEFTLRFTLDDKAKGEIPFDHFSHLIYQYWYQLHLKSVF